MAGTSEGGKKAHRTTIKRHGKSFVKKRNRRAGAAGKGGAFSDPEFASRAARKRWHREEIA